MNTPIIEKELVSSQQFSKREVLSDGYAIAQRQNKLERAMQLGNLYKVKSKIFFETQEGSKVVETTIWAVTNNYIMIKGGRVIPIQCITSVE
jgi:predicted alternative tryptophan synthase beta-subunit